MCVRDKLPHHDGFVRHNVFPEVGHDSCICPETSTTSFHAYKGGDRSGGVRNNCLRKNTYGWPININNSLSLLSSPLLKSYKTILIQTLYQGSYINYVTHWKGTGVKKTLQGGQVSVIVTHNYYFKKSFTLYFIATVSITSSNKLIKWNRKLSDRFWCVT